MSKWREIFGLSESCEGNCDDSSCNCFAQNADGSNEEPGAVEIECDDFLKGFRCSTVNFIGKLNAFFKSIICWLTEHEERITLLENENPIVDWSYSDDNGDGIYSVEVTYKDGTTSSVAIKDSDTRLSNPRPQDTDNNGINDRILWDVVDENGDVVGTETVSIQEYVNTQNKGMKISYIDIPDAIVSNTLAEQTILNTNYSRQFSNSTVYAEAKTKSILKLEKQSSGNDVRGEAKITMSNSDFNKTIVKNETNTLRQSPNISNDFNFSYAFGSCYHANSGSGDFNILIKMKINFIASSVSDYSFSTQDGGYIKIIEVEN